MPLPCHEDGGQISARSARICGFPIRPDAWLMLECRSGGRHGWGKRGPLICAGASWPGWMRAGGPNAAGRRIRIYRATAVIRTPADQFATVWLCHQWKLAWSRIRSRSLARATQRHSKRWWPRATGRWPGGAQIRRRVGFSPMQCSWRRLRSPCRNGAPLLRRRLRRGFCTPPAPRASRPAHVAAAGAFGGLTRPHRRSGSRLTVHPIARSASRPRCSSTRGTPSSGGAFKPRWESSLHRVNQPEAVSEGMWRITPSVRSQFRWAETDGPRRWKPARPTGPAAQRSPDITPTEIVCAKLKTLLKTVAAGCADTLRSAIASALDASPRGTAPDTPVMQDTRQPEREGPQDLLRFGGSHPQPGVVQGCQMGGDPDPVTQIPPNTGIMARPSCALAFVGRSIHRKIAQLTVTTTIMALADARRNWSIFACSPSKPRQAQDSRGTAALLEGLSCGQFLADRAFDAKSGPRGT